MAIHADFINAPEFTKYLRDSMQKQLTAASEALVKEAVAKYESEVRKEIGHMVLSLLTEYSVERMGNVLQIQVRNVK